MTWRLHNAFASDVREILPQSTIIYYLDTLIYSYRYLQNILPVTHVPIDIVEATGPLAGAKLKTVVKLLESETDVAELDWLSLKEIMMFANATAALTATSKGGIPAMPSRAQVDEFLRR